MYILFVHFVVAFEVIISAFHYLSLGSNDYVNNFLQPFLADGEQYTHDDFVELLISTLGEQLTVRHSVHPL